MSPLRLPPPVWTPDQLDVARGEAIERFRVSRMAEPLEDYLEHFNEARVAAETVLEQSVDLSVLRDEAVEVLSDDGHVEVVRYLAGPPISVDDLKVVAGVTLAAKNRSDPEKAAHIIDTVLLGLDRQRFPWVGEDRDPTEAERLAAITATAALIAARRVMTSRQNEAKDEQEQRVKDALLEAGFTQAPPRDIDTLDQAPGLGEFCGESSFGTRKADVVIRLWDHRVMALECKVSNSSTNSVKRLNNDAAVKAGIWIGEFGTAQTVPAAMLAGVFKRHNLEQAQHRGLTIWWSHDLRVMIDWIQRTR